MAVIENSELKITIDVSIPTDRSITERRPDLVIDLKRECRALILEVACAWEPLILEREREKRGKYEELARDLATQLSGWRTQVFPLVVGDLGSLGSFRKELEATGLFDKREVSFIARNCQIESLCAAVRILRQTLSKDD